MDRITFHSTVTHAIKKRALFRGTFIAAIGIGAIAFGGVFLSPKQLDVWGLPLILFGILFIAWGLIPYRRLCRLETTPNRIEMSEEALTFFQGKVALTRIPLISIEKLEYVEKPSLYGIKVHLKDPLPEKVILYSKHASLFLPYFSRRTFVQLQLL